MRGGHRLLHLRQVRYEVSRGEHVKQTQDLSQIESLPASWKTFERWPPVEKRIGREG